MVRQNNESWSSEPESHSQGRSQDQKAWIQEQNAKEPGSELSEPTDHCPRGGLEKAW